MKINEVQKLVIEEDLINSTFLDDIDYEIYLNDLDEDVKDEIMNVDWENQIQSLRAKFKNLLRRLDKLQCKGDK